MPSNIRVSICDSSPALRFGLRYILESDPHIETVLECSSHEELVDSYIDFDMDLLLIDLEEDNPSQFPSLTRFHKLRPDVKIMIFSACRNRDVIMEALNLGIQGFQEKRAEANEIKRSIHVVHNGGSSMADCVTAVLIEQMSKKPMQSQSELSTRETQVLELIASGKSNDDIANRLYISVRTVKFHVTSIFNKLKVKNRTQAAAMWML